MILDFLFIALVVASILTAYYGFERKRNVLLYIGGIVLTISVIYFMTVHNGIILLPFVPVVLLVIMLGVKKYREVEKT